MLQKKRSPLERACNFAQVLKDEREEIARQCEQRKVAGDLLLDGPNTGAGPDLLGLCFSGGGIRSACVGMGILQRSARAGILRQAHYISAISGGGYLLGWLSAWIQRTGSLIHVEAQLGLNTDSGQSPASAAPPAFARYVEPMPVHYLRRYSSYLAPRVGLVSGDTLAMISVYLRNLFLNLLLLVAVLVSLILVLQLLSPTVLWRKAMPGPLIWICVGLFLLAYGTGIEMAGRALHSIGQDQDPKEKTYYGPVAIASALAACGLLWLILPRWYVGYDSLFVTCIAAGVLLTAGSLLTLRWVREPDKLPTAADNDGISPWALLLGFLVFAALCAAVNLGFHEWLIKLDRVYVSDVYVVFGWPVLLLALSFQSYLFIGILGTAFADAKREWLARAAGYFLLAAGAISLLLGAALWGPAAMHLLFTGFEQASWRKYVIAAVLPGGWLFIVLTGLLGANSAKTSGADNKVSPLDFIIAVAPPVFLVGLLLLVSWGTHGLVRCIATREYLSWGEWRPEPAGAPKVLWLTSIQALPLETHTVPQHLALNGPLMVFLTSSFIALLLGLRLNVNEFSLHLFYRNRLIRAFLGASQSPPSVRRPSPFTGFALADDIPLSKLTVEGSCFQGPYPLWGTTLNLTAGEDLAWQQRKGASFLYSPLYCGWDYVHSHGLTNAPESPSFDKDQSVIDTSRKNNLFGYRATGRKSEKVAKQGNAAASTVQTSEGYGGAGGNPYIGTAMAASGAALSPNSGYHTRPGVAALLAIFNLRLGWWTGNPRDPDTWNKYAPSITYLVTELLGRANDRGSYVYLSDGGHFENLGIYELVRRKVRFIICSDADADPNFNFTDLGNAIDKCRRDFGVEIHLRAQRDIGAEGGKGFRSGHYAIGEIIYPGQAAKGCLLYIKSSLTSDEPSDVLGMKAQHAAFPHDSTANQFFDESMFESYRALGEHMLDVILAQCGIADGGKDCGATVKQLYCALVKKGAEQKLADAQPKPAPIAVSVSGGVSVQVIG